MSLGTGALGSTGDAAPPVADGVRLPWDAPVGDPVAALAAARAAHGDEFVVATDDGPWLFTFSPAGVDAFYALAEDDASKGVADYLMLRRKLPAEVFDGRRVLPSSLFRRDDVAAYLAHLDASLEATLVELGEAGEVDVFDLARRLAHRMGLASWGGPGCAEGAVLDELVAAFDVLDGAEAFVRPDRMAAVAASGWAAERAALERVVALLGDALDRLDPATDPATSLPARALAAWADVAATDPAAARRGAALDLALVHVASMSNLAAALGWCLVDLLEHPEDLRRVRDGDREHAAACARESTRLAQRSVMARHVLRPVVLDVGHASYDVAPGTTVATLLPVTGLDPALGHDRWDPARWTGHRFDADGLASPRLSTAFGHGRHTCPAQPFAVAAMVAATTTLLGALDLEPRWGARPGPVPEQVGGVARADRACRVAYARRPAMWSAPRQE